MGSTESKETAFWKLVRGTAAALVMLCVVVVACVALGGWMNHSVELFWGGSNRAATLGTIGQYFDAVSAVFSGLALLLVIGTTVLQRRELAMQRVALEDSNAHLRISAEADLRALHMQLLRMSIDDAELAEVWGTLAIGPPERRRQTLYANLIFSHFFLNHRLGIVSDDEVRGHLRILAQSAAFREYWRVAAASRSTLAIDSDERRFGAIVDEVMAEQGHPPDLHIA